MRAQAEFVGFDWDAGNRDKNWAKHRVSDSECEEFFFNQPLVRRHDPSPWGEERRFRALGQTDTGRRLFVAFTMRGKLLRVISAREMTRRERRFYATYEKREEKTQGPPSFQVGRRRKRVLVHS
jgi:uncharacterized DUF497 family protein